MLETFLGKGELFCFYHSLVVICIIIFLIYFLFIVTKLGQANKRTSYPMMSDYLIEPMDACNTKGNANVLPTLPQSPKSPRALVTLLATRIQYYLKGVLFSWHVLKERGTSPVRLLQILSRILYPVPYLSIVPAPK